MDPLGDDELWKPALTAVSSDEETDSETKSCEDGRELRMKALTEQLAKDEAEKSDVKQQLEELDAIWQRRRRPLQETVDRLDGEIAKGKRALIHLGRSHRTHPDEPPGPPSLSWVDGSWFGIAGNLVIVLNIACMALSPKFREWHLSALSASLGNLFLAWYVFELSVRFAYHRRNLFFGPPSAVWWNWLDLLIVASGLLEEWLLPLLCPASPGGAFQTVLAGLRFMRLLRILRLLRRWLDIDLSWTASPRFEIFMTGVISVNSVTMALELDYDWPVWPFVENTLLAIYTFELSVRIKYAGCRFFTDRGTIVWNLLDFIMVVAGAVDLWLLPGIKLAETTLFDKPGTPESDLGPVLSLLKLMRILRVLRLVRLLRAIKPLYTLLMGVSLAMRAMQWVLILTCLILYASAIIFTTLVTQDLVGAPSDETQDKFGSVQASLFSLFVLMNGDTSVVESIVKSVAGQMIFCAFMVLSNWAVLATLTSVVSESMMTTSAQVAEEDAEARRAAEHQLRADRLRDVFRSVDADSDGMLSEQEWSSLWKDPVLKGELLDASGLSPHVIQDMYRCLVHTGPSGQRLLQFEALIGNLDDISTPADNRSVLHLTSQMAGLQETTAEMAVRMAELSGQLQQMAAQNQIPSASSRPRAGQDLQRRRSPTVLSEAQVAQSFSS